MMPAGNRAGGPSPYPVHGRGRSATEDSDLSLRAVALDCRSRIPISGMPCSDGDFSYPYRSPAIQQIRFPCCSHMDHFIFEVRTLWLLGPACRLYVPFPGRCVRRPPWVRFPPYSTAFSCGLVCGFQGSLFGTPSYCGGHGITVRCPSPCPGDPDRPLDGQFLLRPSRGMLTHVADGVFVRIRTDRPRNASGPRRDGVPFVHRGPGTAPSWHQLSYSRRRHPPTARGEACVPAVLAAGRGLGSLLTGFPYRLFLRGMRR